MAVAAIPCGEAERENRRRAVLKTAAEVFLEEGYAAASMSAIAARLGGSKSALYNYFKSKDELFAAVVGARVNADQCIEAHQDLFSEKADLKTALFNFGRRIVWMFFDPTTLAFHRMLAAEAARFPAVGTLYYENVNLAHARKLADFLQAQVNLGTLCIDDVLLASFQFCELSHAGFYLRSLWNISPKPSDAEIDSAITSAVLTFLIRYGAPGVAL